MSKVKTMERGGQIFFCPGCKTTHSVNTSKTVRWTYNGDADKPTFAPSIKCLTNWREVDEEMTNDVCHSFVVEGRIQFLKDCTHALAGQTVDIPEWPYPANAYGGIRD